MTLARRAARRGRIFLADADCLPQTLAVLATRAEPLGIELVVAAVTPELIADQAEGELFGVLLPIPRGQRGDQDLRPAIDAAHGRGALAAVAADLLALTLLMPPGEMGADIAVGSTQRFGVPMGYGGPHAAYIATRNDLRRQLPGRLVGVSLDADGRPAYRLALQAREQHIRREKATRTSAPRRCCWAVMAAMYAVYHGPGGLAAIAASVHGRAARLAATLRESGLAAPADGFFDTIRVAPARRGRGGGGPGPGSRVQPAPGRRRHGRIACDETTTDAELLEVAALLAAGHDGATVPGGSPGPVRCSRPAWPELGVPGPPRLPRAPE